MVCVEGADGWAWHDLIRRVEWCQLLWDLLLKTGVEGVYGSWLLLLHCFLDWSEWGWSDGCRNADRIADKGGCWICGGCICQSQWAISWMERLVRPALCRFSILHQHHLPVDDVTHQLGINDLFISQKLIVFCLDLKKIRNEIRKFRRHEREKKRWKEERNKLKLRKAYRGLVKLPFTLLDKCFDRLSHFSNKICKLI